MKRSAPQKVYLGKSVYHAAQDRIRWVFDSFRRVYISFSGGKDSTVMVEMVMDEAKKRNHKVGVLFIDLEAQYKLTIDHVQSVYDRYAEWIDPYWVCVPMTLRNAVSQYEPQWTCWETGRENDWVRSIPSIAKTAKDFPFIPKTYPIQFEDFVVEFGSWYSQGESTACLVGIRTGESLNRWRTIAGHGTKLEGKGWTNHVIKSVFNVYPIYDWTTEDIWTFHAKTKLPYNKIYDRMHQAGLTLHQMRICQPYGDDQRKGLWLFHIIEPESWSRIVARVNGANQGSLYAKNTGNILGRIKIDKPEGHTWESFANLLLDSMPQKTSDHFKDKIAIFLKWWEVRGYPDGIPDEADSKLEAKHDVPSWRRICKTLLRNDYWCKGLGFSQQTGTAHQQYKKLMAKRRNQWGIYPVQPTN